MVDDKHYVKHNRSYLSIFYGLFHTITRSLIIFGDTQNAGIGKRFTIRGRDIKT